MAIAALIVAAGRGTRLGGDIPKQYQDLGGEAILTRTIRALLAHPEVGAVLTVIAPDDIMLYHKATRDIADRRLLPPVAGADNRAGSVRAGLEALTLLAPDMVLIHDAARPFVTGEVIGAVIAALREVPGAVPCLPVVDALWEIDRGRAGRAIPRDGLTRAQTPQGFAFNAILAAHRGLADPARALDDVAVAREAGLAVRIVPGDEANVKITTPADLVRARARVADPAVQETAMDIRVGNGFDVHAFGPGDGVTLCGVRLPFDRGLVGHSDADVGMHALTDAIFGALAEGDIGQWFPPSEPEWKGAASEIFLRKAVERADARGFAVSALDCTLVCEKPKIGPRAAEMRAELARITGIDLERISVKATTSERLGFTGREEGIAALATATLVKP
ncbi:bifunctional 2-C-methyl-D-erythritol 4-phosphate cytidylyltransferase/2-C-methyl-D-erythritol 2,4-cyclodiphosphate synthase [Amaricoccus solimangrovi]|uniref:Bifunctional enzyme IspD/IspF n=1 Tax=Amaricoccus solimangrovi TaxID=2589815 RepID=A0A501WY21_9RHOB|nr:bifunctional 2-C-methyl-D-erythritol 4-phosphate cytidylyltransferase/2-C-methyl-D-erythritol 2,4-cyclodiphosphate synthase [Amaricoccus solimangrovi]TPE53155.1 bifunctional 2-C-methyl-D-erythritol 4-phosphate cytidylyltransferase/2-C-methyl-D-erythritol 2,4-cyclodiphosphate synthase [Amaricoccus solimangrovi]